MGDWRVNFHKEMTGAVDKWFWSFYVPSDGYRMIELSGIEYHFCGSEAVLKREFKKRNNGESLDHIQGLAGWGGKEGQIWVVAHFGNGRIIPNQYALGHELQHLLSHVDTMVPNPDQAVKKEYYT